MTWLGHKIFFTFSRAQFFKNLHQKWTSKTAIRHFYISHDAPRLPPPPQILHNLCISFLLCITAVPRETEHNAYAKCLLGVGGGQIRCIMGNVEMAKCKKQLYNSFPCSVLLSTIEMTSNCSKLCRETIRLICKHFDLDWLRAWKIVVEWLIGHMVNN